MARHASGVPESVSLKAEKASASLVPQKSALLYNKEYVRFQKWTSDNQVKVVNETVLMAYFQDLQSESFSPNTLWTELSMLKCMLTMKEKVDISKFRELEAFLKSKSRTYEPKKSAVLSREQIRQFIREAPDETFLMCKVALIMGLFGGCRTDELIKMNNEDIDDRGPVMVINSPHTKTGVKKSFSVIDETELSALSLIRKYRLLRPPGVGRFFLTYREQRCTVQPVGKNTFGNIPCKIATYLDLENPKSYTGHCLRRTSATILADSGASITTLKRHGAWKSSSVAEGYVADSMSSKNKISRMIAGVRDMEKPSTSTNDSQNSAGRGRVTSVSDLENTGTFANKSFSCVGRGISFSGKFDNCQFHL